MITGRYPGIFANALKTGWYGDLPQDPYGQIMLVSSRLDDASMKKELI